MENNTDSWEEKYKQMFDEMPTSNLWYTVVKSFISQELEKARRDAVSEHDAKWHPIENNKLLTHQEVIQKAHASGYQKGRQETILEMVGQHFMLPEERASKMVEQIRQEERERIVKLIDSMKKISFITGTSPYPVESKTLVKLEGWNQALEELKKKI